MPSPDRPDRGFDRVCPTFLVKFSPRESRPTPCIANCPSSPRAILYPSLCGVTSSPSSPASVSGRRLMRHSALGEAATNAYQLRSRIQGKESSEAEEYEATNRWGATADDCPDDESNVTTTTGDRSNLCPGPRGHRSQENSYRQQRRPAFSRSVRRGWRHWPNDCALRTQGASFHDDDHMC